MKYLFLNLIIVITLFVSCFVFVPNVLAVDPVKKDPNITSLDNPLQYEVNGEVQGVTDVQVLIGIIIKSVLGMLGSIALLMFVWGGFTWLISRGNEEKVKAGTNTMLFAGLGVFVVLASYILVNFILSLIS